MLESGIIHSGQVMKCVCFLYVCTHGRYVWVYVCMRCVHVCMCMSLRTCMCVCGVCMFVCIVFMLCMCVCSLYICVYVYVCVCV